ncbi:hypothetical protein [Microseira wollei]|nr:hypothetical protein [Microseira wollei]
MATRDMHTLAGANAGRNPRPETGFLGRPSVNPVLVLQVSEVQPFGASFV